MDPQQRKFLHRHDSHRYIDKREIQWLHLPHIEPFCGKHWTPNDTMSRCKNTHLRNNHSCTGIGTDFPFHPKGTRRSNGNHWRHYKANQHDVARADIPAHRRKNPCYTNNCNDPIAHRRRIWHWRRSREVRSSHPSKDDNFDHRQYTRVCIDNVERVRPSFYHHPPDSFVPGRK